MKIMKLEREEEEYFGWLDPYGFLERLSLPDHFAFVSAEENGEADTPTGLVAACVRDSIIIEWLCVDTAHRGRGTGSALIGHLKELAEKNGIGLSARLTYAPDMTETMDNGAEFLMASGFVPTGDFCREWMTDLHTVFSMDYFRQDLKGLKETEAADGIPPALLKKAAEGLYKKDGALSLYDITEYPTEYDGSISRVIRGDKGIAGMLLIKRHEDTLFPVFLYAASAEDRRALLLAAAQSVKREMKDLGNVSIICRDRASSDFYEDLFPGEGYEAEMLGFYDPA